MIYLGEPSRKVSRVNFHQDGSFDLLSLWDRDKLVIVWRNGEKTEYEVKSRIIGYFADAFSQFVGKIKDFFLISRLEPISAWNKALETSFFHSGTVNLPIDIPISGACDSDGDFLTLRMLCPGRYVLFHDRTVSDQPIKKIILYRDDAIHQIVSIH